MRWVLLLCKAGGHVTTDLEAASGEELAPCNSCCHVVHWAGKHLCPTITIRFAKRYPEMLLMPCSVASLAAVHFN